MKICRKCGYEKKIEEFAKNSNRKDGLQNYCKVCKAQSDKKSNLKHPSRIKGGNRKKIDRKSLLRDKWKIKKGGECLKCKENRLYVLDFHHIDINEKRIDISTLIGHVGDNNPLIKEEINKCILLCSNCHREFHYFEKLKNINIKDYLA